MPKNYMIFLHGLEGTSQGVKATLLREIFPQIVTPDFSGSLDERMEKLELILEEGSGWQIIGSSFGGLMAALYASRHPEKVQKLILLAPALVWPDFASSPPDPIDVPTTIFHGTQDQVVPLSPVMELAERSFKDLTFHVVEDDHGLYQTVHEIDWCELLECEPSLEKE